MFTKKWKCILIGCFDEKIYWASVSNWSKQYSQVARYLKKEHVKHSNLFLGIVCLQREFSAHVSKSEYPLNEGCVIFFKLVHMQHYQIFWLSDSHIFIKNCHLWYIDFWAFKENQK